MGIPAYFRNIIRDCPSILTPINHNIKIDYLLLDLNCAIHPCCRGETDESVMMKKVIDKIKECIDITNVQKNIYIAIDGPAPRTKMEQQRQRRLRSSQETKIWDTNSITPGTNFMNTLSKYLDKELKKINVPYILSDSNDPGEGEHKIMKYIDTLSLNDTMCVYGLDADLLMLSMIREQSIFLLRERTEYNIEDMEDDYVYCNITLLKKHLIETIKTSNIKLSDKSILYDYLVMCFFIGNDFILSSPSINIRYHGIQTLLFIYNELQKEYHGMFYLLDENKDIHFENFKKFLQTLSESEETNIRNIMNIREKQERGIMNRYRHIYKEYKDPTSNSNHEKYEDMKCHLPILERNTEKEVFAGNYQKKYYLYNLYNTFDESPEYKYVVEEDSKTISHDYIKSIYWTIKYYFKECVSWRWYYPHHIPPLLTDVYKVCTTFKSFDHLFTEKDKPYSPLEQLSIVLPKSSHNLLPTKDNLYGDDYYPVETPLHGFLKRYLWECHPLLIHKNI